MRLRIFGRGDDGLDKGIGRQDFADCFGRDSDGGTVEMAFRDQGVVGVRRCCDCKYGVSELLLKRAVARVGYHGLIGLYECFIGLLGRLGQFGVCKRRKEHPGERQLGDEFHSISPATFHRRYSRRSV